MGSGGVHEVVERIPLVEDVLVIGLEQPDGGYRMPLFVVLADGAELDDGLRDTIRRALREGLSPRHVPDEVIQVPEIPRTLTGKRLEVPVKRILAGVPVDEAVNTGSLANPGALTAFVELSRRR